MYIANAISFFLDPFYTFFDGTRQLILTWLSKVYADKIYHIPITPNLHVSTPLCCGVMIGQALFYMLIVIWKDNKDCNAFKKVGGADGVLQPQLQVYTDILDHEKTVKDPINDSEYLIKAVDLKKTYP